jgi:hypothetical protein
LPQLKTPALTRLEGQLRSKARGALLEDLSRAEDLAVQVEPGVTYPEDWVVFRITGSQQALAQTDMLVGADLRAELSTLVMRLACASSGGSANRL